MKKKIVIVTVALLLLMLVLQGCTTTGEETQATVTAAATETAAATAKPTATASPATAEAPEATAASDELVLTLEELSQYDGKNGNPAYIAVDGVIYDVTNVTEWNGGDHNGFTAGQDLTEAIKTVSPHGVSKLNGVPVVGTLAN